MAKPVTHPVIVVGVDGSPASKVAVQWAAREAALRNAPLMLAHAISPTLATLGMPMPPGLARWQKQQARRIIDEARKIVEEIRERPLQVDSELLFSGPVSGLVDLSKYTELIVVGCRGRGTGA